jgi:vacuolar-type H+-ATPase catalytic subunit A/Vma1
MAKTRLKSQHAKIFIFMLIQLKKSYPNFTQIKEIIGINYKGWIIWRQAAAHEEAFNFFFNEQNLKIIVDQLMKTKNMSTACFVLEVAELNHFAFFNSLASSMTSSICIYVMLLNFCPNNYKSLAYEFIQRR